MKHMTLRMVVIIQAFVGATAGVALAQEDYSGDSVTCRTNGTQFRQGGGEYEPLTNSMTLARDIEVFTNCMFRVNEGKDRPLPEGQTLRADGFMLSADGSIVPVRDHIEMTKGMVMVYKDGKGSALTSTLTLPDGTGISSDGSYVRSSGRRSRLADGQLLTLEGAPIQGFDTISMHGGRVVVYKSGSLIPLQSAVVIMGMADGTRVRGDGVITSPTGTTSQLKEGQIITMPALRRDW
jgi:hypothetical protein